MVRNVTPDENAKIVSAPQHMTQTCLGSMDQQIEHALTEKASAILMDLSSLQAVDSASLNWLLQTQTRLALLKIELRIHNPSEIAHDVLLATRLDSRFTITTTPENVLVEAGSERNG